MPYTNESDASGLDAAGSLSDELHALLDKGAELALAVALGSLLARWLRRRGLHWSWSAAALAPLLALDHAVGPLAVAALATATLRGRRWHREDLHLGLDLARADRRRLTPLAAARLAASGALAEPPRSAVAVLAGLGRAAAAVRAGAGRPAPAAARAARSATLLLGRGRDGRAVLVPFEPDGGGHTLVVGATGSGKTVTQTLLAVRAIEQGRGAIVIDPKGDARLRERLAAAAAQAGREFVLWTPAGPTAYNPYARGGDTEIADRLLAGERFTEPHYLRQAQRYLGHAVRAMRACDTEVSLPSLVQLLEPTALEQLLRCAPQELAAGGHAYLDSLTPRQLRDLAGVRDRLAILAESDAGRWLDPAADGPPAFDLLGAAHERAVVYFGLDADSRPLLAQMLGAAVLQDLQSAVSVLQADPVPTIVVIDEFAAISGARRLAVRPRPLRGAVAAARHAGDLGSAAARPGAHARAGDGQPVLADRAPAGRPLLGRARVSSRRRPRRLAGQPLEHWAHDPLALRGAAAGTGRARRAGTGLGSRRTARRACRHPDRADAPVGR